MIITKVVEELEETGPVLARDRRGTLTGSALSPAP